jgi:uncharacterized protein YciU (UPF0263 family)
MNYKLKSHVALSADVHLIVSLFSVDGGDLILKDVQFNTKGKAYILRGAYGMKCHDDGKNLYIKETGIGLLDHKNTHLSKIDARELWGELVEAGCEHVSS